MLELINAVPFPDWISDTAVKIGPIAIKWYGISYIVGLYLAYFYARKTVANRPIWQPRQNTSSKMNVPDKKILEDFLFYCLVGIIVGGRLGYIILYGLPDYLKDPIRIFKVWEGGMAFHGGFLGVVIATTILAKTRKIPLARLSDLAAISAPIGIGLVRLANFVNQELYGRMTDVPWAFIFYENGYPLEPRHPSQLYESALEGVTIFLVLFLLSRKARILTKPWMATGIFICMYGSFRIFVEFFREPDAPLFGPLTRGMSYSLPMVIIGIVLIFWARSRQAVAPEFRGHDGQEK